MKKMSNFFLKEHYRWGAILVLLFAILFSACLSEINLDAPEGNSSAIAIRGVLVADTAPHLSVRITKVSDFRKFEIPEPVSGATVVLSDEQGRQVYVPMGKTGYYELILPDHADDLQVATGKSYQLTVTTAEGKTYVSALETLHPVPVPTGIDTTTLRREVINDNGILEEQEFIRFLIRTPVVNPDRSGWSFLKWSFLGTYKFQETGIESPFPPNAHTCYFNEELNLDKVVVFNGATSSRDSVEGFYLLEEPLDYRFYAGFYLSVFQQSLSEGAYHYWEQIGKVVDLSGTFFEAPPGKVRGNFHNPDDPEEEVFGYFYATQEVAFRYYVAPLPDRVFSRCPASTSNPDEVDYVCLHCLSQPGSTLIKPDFWEH